jgi:hypothetical protein
MDFFIKKIFEEKIDEHVHNQFQKFSRGEFPKRAMFKIKTGAGKYIIDTTSEYARELIRFMAERLGHNKTLVQGALVTAIDMDGKFKYEEKKMAMGVRKYVINREMAGNEIIDLCDNVPKAFFGLSFKVGDEELKIKDKSPKSAKGASGSKGEDEELKIDFCKLKTTDKKIVENLLFDSEIQDFKKAEVRHDFIITDIIIPAELKNEKDFANVRDVAKRKGKILRIINVDGKIIKKETEFEA